MLPLVSTPRFHAGGHLALRHCSVVLMDLSKHSSHGKLHHRCHVSIFVKGLQARGRWRQDESPGHLDQVQQCEMKLFFHPLPLHKELQNLQNMNLQMPGIPFQGSSPGAWFCSACPSFIVTINALLERSWVGWKPNWSQPKAYVEKPVWSIWFQAKARTLTFSDFFPSRRGLFCCCVEILAKALLAEASVLEFPVAQFAAAVRDLDLSLWLVLACLSTDRWKVPPDFMRTPLSFPSLSFLHPFSLCSPICFFKFCFMSVSAVSCCWDLWSRCHHSMRHRRQRPLKSSCPSCICISPVCQGNL